MSEFGEAAGEVLGQHLIADMTGLSPVILRDGDRIMRSNAAMFGPGDLYCSIWNFLALAGLSSEDWTPQYNYWIRPAQLDDGGKNVID